MFNKLEVANQIKYKTFNKICELEINKNGKIRDYVLNLILEKPEVQVEIIRPEDIRP